MGLRIEQSTREAIERGFLSRMRNLLEELEESLRHMGEFPWAFSLCDSEIERVFLSAWIQKLHGCQLFGAYHGGSAGFVWLPPDYPLDSSDFRGSDALQIDVIFPQHVVGDFRPDFILKRGVRDVDDEKFRWTSLVIVECDGHDFHEKTKEQAKRDKKRDRVFQLAGYKVLHFTGSEIWKNASECADQVDELLQMDVDEYYRTRREAKAAGGQ